MLTKQTNIFTAFIRDLFLGWTTKEAIYAWFLILLQVITFIWNPDSIAGFISGLCGTICVVLVAKRKLSNYLFGLIQTIVGVYLGLQFRLWGEASESMMYLVAQFVGFWAWKNQTLWLDY